MASLGFVVNLLIYRNAQRKGALTGMYYPAVKKDLFKMGAKWLTEALQNSKTIPEDVDVVSFKERALSGSGIMSDLILLDVEYSKETPDAPKSMVIKLAPSSLKTRGICQLFNFNKKEAYMYSGDLLSTMPFASPKCYFTDHNDWTGNICIILEHLEESCVFHKSGSSDYNLAQAKLLMQKIAQLHATFFGKTDSERITFINKVTDNKVPQMAKKLLVKNFPPLIQGKQYPTPKIAGQKWDLQFYEEYAKRSELLINNMISLCTAFALWPEFFTVVHGDARWENFYFFKDSDGKDDCGMIDFQLVQKCEATGDIGNFFFNCNHDFLKENEEAIVDSYFEDLQKAGGPTVEKNSEDRQMWEEVLDISIICLIARQIIGIDGMDVTNPDTIPTLSKMFQNMWSIIQRRNSLASFDKFCKEELIVQKRHPELNERIGASPK